MKGLDATRIIMRHHPGRPDRLVGCASKIILVLSAALGLAGPGIAHDDLAIGNLSAPDSSSPLRKETLRLPNVEVVDQHGHVRHFRSELITGRTVVVNFIYTHCSAVCSPITLNLKRVRDLLDPALASRIAFISIAVDPENDRPEALTRFAEQHGISKGWTFVTGDPEKLRQIQKAFSVATTRKEDHSPVVIIGNDARNIWIRKPGFGRPEAIVDAIRAIER